MLQEKLEILKAKIKRIVEESHDASALEFLSIIAAHEGYLFEDSIDASFNRFKQKYGSGRFEEILKDFINDGIVCEKHGLRFATFDEKGEYDHEVSNNLSKFVSKLIFDSDPQIKQNIDKILEEPEGEELLKCVAKENGISIINGQEPRVKEIIGRQTYERLIENLVNTNILVKYARSSRMHAYTGYKVLPYVGEYLRSKLGIFELENAEKIILGYIGSMEEIFGFPAEWYLWFNYPNEHDHRTLKICSLHKKLLATLIRSEEKEFQKIIDGLKSKNLVKEVDLGYTRGGSHRGIVLRLTEFGQKIFSQIKEEIKLKIESMVMEVFSNSDNCMVYHLFSHEKIPLKVLMLVKRENLELLQKAGFVGDEEDIFLAFKEGTPCYDYISRVACEDTQKELKDKCTRILSSEQKMFLGFLSQCKTIILGKYADYRSWNQVSSRTQRQYEASYENTIVNFPYLKKVFSFLTGLSDKKVDEIVSKLENEGFLTQQKAYSGFSGNIIAYRVPIKFSFDLQRESLTLKIREYVNFLAKDIEKHYNQLIFLDFLTQAYNAYGCDFSIRGSHLSDFLSLLNYKPPLSYIPIYAFEGEVVIIHSDVKEELEKQIYELKLKLIEPIKKVLLQLTADFRSASYNFLEKITKNCYLIEIESPDPSVGIVSFVITPWISPFIAHEISSYCIRSNVINLFTSYPNYPQIKAMMAADGSYNLTIVRDKTAHLYLKKVDQISQAIFAKLAEHLKIKKEEEEVKRKIEELEEKFPNLRKVRFIIPEVEELLRNAVRATLIKKFGNKWQEIIRQRFPKAESRRQDWLKEHPTEQADILRGLSIGEFVTLFEDKEFSFLKNCFKDFDLAKVSINKFLKRKEYHHGKPKDGKDIPNEEIEIPNTAYRTLNEMVKTENS